MRFKSFALATALILGTGILFDEVAAQGDGGGGGGFWERMSGPGKWWGLSGYVGVCLNDGKKGATRRADNDRLFCRVESAKLWLNLGASYYGAAAEEEPELKTQGLSVASFEPSIAYRVTTLGESFPIYAGVGAGVHVFSGTDLVFTRGSVEPRIGFMWAFRDAFVEVRFTAKFFPEGFTAQDFGDPRGTYTSDGAEWVKTVAFIVGFH